MSNIEVIDKGIRCLSENMGAQETEIFITALIREQFDYTKWRQTYIDHINTFDELDKEVDIAHKAADFEGSPKVEL